jgi:hypothetical protein
MSQRSSVGKITGETAPAEIQFHGGGGGGGFREMF